MCAPDQRTGFFQGPPPLWTRLVAVDTTHTQYLWSCANLKAGNKARSSVRAWQGSESNRVSTSLKVACALRDRLASKVPFSSVLTTRVVQLSESSCIYTERWSEVRFCRTVRGTCERVEGESATSRCIFQCFVLYITEGKSKMWLVSSCSCYLSYMRERGSSENCARCVFVMFCFWNNRLTQDGRRPEAAAQRCSDTFGFLRTKLVIIIALICHPSDKYFATNVSFTKCLWELCNNQCSTLVPPFMPWSPNCVSAIMCPPLLQKC